MRVWIGFLLLFSATAARAWTVVGPGLSGWNASRLPLYYNFSDCTLDEAELLAIVDRAIASWNAAPTSGITLVRVPDAITTTVADFNSGTAPLTPLLICDTGFTANQAVDGDSIPALTRLGTSGGRVTYAGVVLNAESGKAARIDALGATALEVAIAHELGHALGLGHSEDARALMYYSLTGKTASVLSEDDTDGLAFLYPRNEFSAGPFGCASVRGPSSRGALAWLVALLLVPIALGRWIRPGPLPGSRERLP